jgi:hypothetical protein
MRADSHADPPPDRDLEPDRDLYADCDGDGHAASDRVPVRHSASAAHRDNDRQHDADPPCDQGLDGGAHSHGDGHSDAQAGHENYCREDSDPDGHCHADGDPYVLPQGHSSQHVHPDRNRYSGSAAEFHTDLVARVCALSPSGIRRWAGSP